MKKIYAVIRNTVRYIPHDIRDIFLIDNKQEAEKIAGVLNAQKTIFQKVLGVKWVVMEYTLYHEIRWGTDENNKIPG